MKGTYAYSLDRETFSGIFNSRKEAFDAGVKQASRLNASVTEIYVGHRVTGDTQANLHAWPIIKLMRTRAKEAAGDEAREYLSHVTEDQARDLDGAIETAINRWLANHKLAPQFSRIEAISEHPIPAVAQIVDRSDDEVYDIGVGDEYPASR